MVDFSSGRWHRRREGRESDAPMDSSSVPSALQERLGPEATSGLVRLFEVARIESMPEIVNLSTERFERRLVEETAGIRIEMAQQTAILRQEIAQPDLRYSSGRSFSGWAR